MKYMPLIVQDIPYQIHIGRDTAGSLHWHSEMELLVCLRGSLQLMLENQVFILRAGDAMILPGYAAHSASSEDPQSWRLAINFGYGLLKSSYSQLWQSWLPLPEGQQREYPQLYQVVWELARLCQTENADSDTLRWRIQAQLLLLCAGLREAAPIQTLPDTLQNRVRRLENMFTAVDYVAKHYGQKITIEQMADLTGYAKSYFCKQFKQITGNSFYRYLTCYRISVACTLLANPHYSLNSVAEMTGFSTQPLFCRAFRQITGMSPTQFQALPQKEKIMTWMN